MKTFKTLGSDCKNCNITVALIALKAKAAGVVGEIMGHGVMSSPNVVVN